MAEDNYFSVLAVRVIFLSIGSSSFVKPRPFSAFRCSKAYDETCHETAPTAPAAHVLSCKQDPTGSRLLSRHLSSVFSRKMISYTH